MAHPGIVAAGEGELNRVRACLGAIGDGLGVPLPIDGAAFSVCSSPVTYVDLDGGVHTFQVRAVDTTGNADSTPATFSWFVSGKRSK